MNEPTVSFVVNAYNTEPFVACCLRSIFNQEEAPSFEVIVIDDCSTDGTESEIRQFADPRLVYLRNEVNVNAAESVNRAMKVAKAPIIARIDSDDEYRTDFLAKTLPYFEASADVGLVYGDVAYMNDQGQLTGGGSDLEKRRKSRPNVGNELIPLLYDNFIPAATIIARREAWKDVLPVPAGRNFCDWYWTLNMAKKWQFAFVNQVLANYRLHPGNMHKDMVRQKYGETITWQNLQEIFGSTDLGPEHKSIQNEVYATQAAVLAQKYFGFEMNTDARRCLIKSFYHRPSWLLTKPELLRWLVATLMPRKAYNTLKSWLK